MRSAMPQPPRLNIQLVTASVAIGAIGGLVGLTVTGVLTALPQWAAVLVVVAELMMPLIVYRILKRAAEKGQRTNDR